MSTLAHPERTLPAAAPGTRHRLMRGAVAVSALVTVLYAALFFIVRNVELTEGAPGGSTYGAYLFLALAYLVSTLAYAARDRRGVWLAGAVLQVVVIGLFVAFGIGLFGPGVFDYELLTAATPVGLWAGVITGLEVVLLGVLGYLATLKPAGRHAA